MYIHISINFIKVELGIYQFIVFCVGGSKGSTLPYCVK